jgi:hypothetical protein
MKIGFYQNDFKILKKIMMFLGPLKIKSMTNLKKDHFWENKSMDTIRHKNDLL